MKNRFKIWMLEVLQSFGGHAKDIFCAALVYVICKASTEYANSCYPGLPWFIAVGIAVIAGSMSENFHQEKATPESVASFTGFIFGFTSGLMPGGPIWVNLICLSLIIIAGAVWALFLKAKCIEKTMMAVEITEAVLSYVFINLPDILEVPFDLLLDAANSVIEKHITLYLKTKKRIVVLRTCLASCAANTQKNTLILKNTSRFDDYGYKQEHLNPIGNYPFHLRA